MEGVGVPLEAAAAGEAAGELHAERCRGRR